MSRYPYVILPSNVGPVYKPLIRVNLLHQKTHKATPQITALIDSGADVCFCLRSIGIWLGISFDKKRATHTFIAANRTKFEADKETVILSVANRNYSCPFFFTDVLPAETPIILGQFGFFDHFIITFNIQDKVIEII